MDRQPEPARISPSGPVVAPGPLQKPEQKAASNPSYPAIVHAAVFSAFVIPIAFLPYLAARRHIVKMQRTVQHLEQQTGYLKRALDLTVSSHNSTRAELSKLRDLTQKMDHRTAELFKDVVEDDKRRRTSDEVIATELRKLTDETQHSRSVFLSFILSLFSRLPIFSTSLLIILDYRTQAATLRALGMSLADVAAFMQEVELDFGMKTANIADRRGIERLRLLALRMQSLQVSQHHGSGGESVKVLPFRCRSNSHSQTLI